MTAQGISDAFRDAEWCAAGIDAWLSGARSCANVERIFAAQARA